MGRAGKTGAHLALSDREKHQRALRNDFQTPSLPALRSPVLQE